MSENQNFPRPLRILVADDNLINQKVAARQVEKLGYSVVTAANGSEALAALEVDCFDLIFMDCHMPDVDGFEATRRIRSSDRVFKTVRIVAMTADVTSEDQQKCFSAGMDDFVAKPTKLESLQEAIEKMLRAAG